MEPRRIAPLAKDDDCVLKISYGRQSDSARCDCEHEDDLVFTPAGDAEDMMICPQCGRVAFRTPEEAR